MNNTGALVKFAIYTEIFMQHVYQVYCLDHLLMLQMFWGIAKIVFRIIN